jgi:hypothetical protein
VVPEYEITHPLGLSFTASRRRRPAWLWRILRRVPGLRRWAYVTRPFSGATAYGYEVAPGVSEITSIVIAPRMDAEGDVIELARMDAAEGVMPVDKLARERRMTDPSVPHAR